MSHLLLQNYAKNILGFWRKVDTYEEQPDIHFLHQLILVLETDQPDHRIGWSTLQNFNHLLADSTRVPTVKVISGLSKRASAPSVWQRGAPMSKIFCILVFIFFVLRPSITLVLKVLVRMNI